MPIVNRANPNFLFNYDTQSIYESASGLYIDDLACVETSAHLWGYKQFTSIIIIIMFLPWDNDWRDCIYYNCIVV
jgi:hypothetical protein